MTKRRDVRPRRRAAPLRQDVSAKPAEDRHLHDARLVSLCLEGDQAAWGELLVRHRPLILSIARRHGFDREGAEDLYQATCMTMLERLDILRDHRSLAAWVATTATRKAWRLGRSSLVTSELSDDLPSQAISPDLAFAQAAHEAALRECLDELAEPCRSLLLALFEEEAGYEETAHRLGLAIGSIGVYRRRCLERLRQRMAARGWTMREDT